ncbi:MAG: hypothetical protein ACI4D4_01385 [Lachnospira sp.]
MKNKLSIVLLLFFAVCLLVFLKSEINKNLDKTVDISAKEIKEQLNGDEQESSTGEFKILDNNYFGRMGEEITVVNLLPSDRDSEYKIKVTDAKLLKNATEFQSGLGEDIYYSKDYSGFLIGDNTFGDGAYHFIVTVEIINDSDTTRELLVPGGFNIEFISSEANIGSSAKDRISNEICYGIILDGELTSQKGHIFVEPGMSTTVELMTVFTQSMLDKYKEKGLSPYLCVGSSYISRIPNDGNRVKFVRLEFNYEG